jgi:hypothetical protein
LIQKWGENEARLEESTAGQRFLYSLGSLQMRGYFGRLLNMLLHEHFKDFS